MQGAVRHEGEMRIARLIMMLVLTLALFPWGAYSAVLTAGALATEDGRSTGDVVQIVAGAAPATGEAQTARQVITCHGPALNGSACQPLSAVIPTEMELPEALRQAAQSARAARWPNGQIPEPMRTPPRFS